MPGPRTPASISTFGQRYCQPGEGPREVYNRIASVLADNSTHYHQSREIMSDGFFVPAGRILTGAGSTKQVCLHNCFVSGPIHDSLKGIMQRCTEGALTMQRGGGIGYDFSTLRPRGDAVRSVQGKSSGPISYIKMYDAMGRTISSAGERRGAQMGILRVDHPDIEEFIFAKHNGDQITSFNLSIAITDAFMHAVVADAPFDLKFEDRIYRTIRARDLWETIMRSTWDWAEPGVIFIDRINEENNLNYCEVISATNPCSEQPLPPFGACLLGSFNLAAYLRPKSNLPVLASERYVFDWATLADHIPVIVRAMDNVVERAMYPLKEQQGEALATRRMGLGVMATANAVEALGRPYGTPDFIKEMDFILNLLKNEAYHSSVMLAKEKGAFPRYARERYLERPFIKRLSPKVQAEIAEYGIRNSHLLSIAPTGTISFCMDNVSSGIEPVFAPKARRRVRGLGEVDVTDYGVSRLGVTPKCADEVTAGEHVSVLCAAQAHIDSSVSKTCNVSSEMPWEDFKDLYFLAWRNGAKGCATFQNGGKRKGVMTALPVENCEGGRCERL